MKFFLIKAFILCSVLFTSVNSFSQTVGKIDTTQKVYTVKTSCGKCKFGMTGKTCDLAVKLNNKTYYVEGAAIDDFGDAHAGDGFCNAVRQAKVQGSVVNGKFVATYFELVPQKKKK
jgi:hypothetical protein